MGGNPRTTLPAAPTTARRHRRLSLARTGAAVLLAASLTACQGVFGGSGPTDSPSAPQEIADHEGGPEAPIAEGLTVPPGAVQLGPLVRLRSDRTIAAYQEDLALALTRQGIADAVSAAGRNAEGIVQPTPPTIRKSARPDDDTYALLEEPPPADVTVALIRLDQNQTEAVMSIAEQIAGLLPEADLDPADFTSYCPVDDEKLITGCSLDVEGMTDDGREVAVSMQVEVGDLSTRTSSPSALTSPVMQLRLVDRTDPTIERAASQADTATEGDEDGSTQDDGSSAGTAAAVEEYAWPAMDRDAPDDTPLLNGTLPAIPENATLLLSAHQPAFAALAVDTGAEAREIARAYVESAAPDATVRTDSYEGLNEVDVTLTATTADGARATATHIITARGHYVMLFHTPAS